MNVHQIQALLTGAIALLLGWQLIRTLRSGEVTVTVNGRNVTRAESPRAYWFWTAVLVVLELVVIGICVSAIAGR